MTPEVDLCEWTVVDSITPIEYPGVIKVTMPDQKEFTIMLSEIDIMHGEMAGILYEQTEEVRK